MRQVKLLEWKYPITIWFCLKFLFIGMQITSSKGFNIWLKSSVLIDFINQILLLINLINIIKYNY